MKHEDLVLQVETTISDLLGKLEGTVSLYVEFPNPEWTALMDVHSLLVVASRILHKLH